MIEKEIKILLKEEDYNNLYNYSKKIQSVKVIQTNYYFDTDDFIFRQNNTTIRIRENGECHTLTIKIKNTDTNSLLFNNVKVTNEYSYKLNSLTAKSLIQNLAKLTEAVPEIREIFEYNNLCLPRVKSIGKLVTERIKFKPIGETFTVELDKNIYLNTKDWELECEIQSDKDISIFENWIEGFNFRIDYSQYSKSQRFIAKIVENESEHYKVSVNK